MVLNLYAMREHGHRNLWAVLATVLGHWACTPGGSVSEAPPERPPLVGPSGHSPSEPRSAAPKKSDLTPATRGRAPPEESFAPPPTPPEVHGTYSWTESVDPQQTVAARTPTPKHFERVAAERGTFAEWLRTLPVKPGRPPVHLYNGELKGNQSAQELVIDIDTGPFNLQQCADAVMRLRAEYLYSRDQFNAIHFNFTTGDRASYSRWRQGFRPKVKGNQVSWHRTAPATTGYKGFRRYLDSVFTYAGTASLARELDSKKISEIAPGDVLIEGGFPGHAVIVVDVAKMPEKRETIFLLAQSYMPAQEMHVLRNPGDPSLSPWYSVNFGEELVTPEWTFSQDQLKQFRSMSEHEGRALKGQQQP